MSNHLADETSPYLLQHKDNPVNWYAWGKEAFERARAEDKPVFLSIGYSTCHWCHVMAHESFEDKEIAEILNKSFISVKVDKEERPDVDGIYMNVCQAFTGGGGWPMSVFMTWDRKPFFAGTYFPKTSRFGVVGFKDLLLAVCDKWVKDRGSLLTSADEVVKALNRPERSSVHQDESVLKTAYEMYRQSFDAEFGGFGTAPKFPSPHNLMFLMQYYRKNKEKHALNMAEKTLLQMYRGGIFDHIGFGFCRYSTDRYYLIPHFEKMLSDNALLISAYCRAYELTENRLYIDIAEKTARYVLNEMRGEQGAFYSAQDADSDGEEGRFYVLSPDEITKLLGEEHGNAFNAHYAITESGNFDGKSVPNLLSSEMSDEYDCYLPRIREYRKTRATLATDDKILLFSNSLMIASLCSLYALSRKSIYLDAAVRAYGFIKENMLDKNKLHVSFRDGVRGKAGFVDDYAAYAFALLALYRVTFDEEYLNGANDMCQKAIDDYFDKENGGFYFCGKDNESMIMRPKESSDGAAPSGNSLMAHNLLRLDYALPDDGRREVIKKLMAYTAGVAGEYPMGYASFLTAYSDYVDEPERITVVKGEDGTQGLAFHIPSDAFLRVKALPDAEHKALNSQTTVYVCKDRSCRPPVNKTQFCEYNTDGARSAEARPDF